MLVEVGRSEQQFAPSRAVLVGVLDADSFEPERSGGRASVSGTLVNESTPTNSKEIMMWL